MDDKDQKIHELTVEIAKLQGALARYKAAIRMLTRILDTSNNLIKRLEEIENGTVESNQETPRRFGQNLRRGNSAR